MAITRAKTDLVILTTAKAESPFLSQLGKIRSLHWDSLPAFEPEKRKARIEVMSQDGFGSKPTVSIKNLLKSAGFSYHSKTRSWFRNCDRCPDSLNELLNEQWAIQSNHVQVAVFDENNELRVRGPLVDGKPVAGEMLYDKKPEAAEEGNA